MKRIYYHGSPTYIKGNLEPRFDSRLNVLALFVSDDKYGPSMFSLLSDRANSSLEYETYLGRFISGTVKTSHLNDFGWLYTLYIEDDYIVNIEGDLYTTQICTPLRITKVYRPQQLELGWKVELIKK